MVKILNQELENTLLKNSVEGNESVWGFAIREGNAAIDMTGVSYRAELNPELLIEYLRSEIPISSDIRNWIADLLDPNLETRVRLEMYRSSGSPKKSRIEHVELVQDYMRLVRQNEQKGYAVAKAAEIHGVTEGVAREAIKMLKPAIEEIERLKKENI